MSKTKKYILIILIGIASIIVTSIIHGLIVDSKVGYKIYTSAEKNHTYLFIEKYAEKLVFDYAIGNDREQISIYQFDKDYKLLIWDINGFSSVNLSELHLMSIENFNEIKFTSFRDNNFGHYRIISELETLQASKIELWTNIDFNVQNHFETIDFAYLNLISKGLIVSVENKAKIKLESEKDLVFNYAFVNNHKGFHFIILTHEKNHDMNNDLLLKILNSEITTKMLIEKQLQNE